MVGLLGALTPEEQYGGLLAPMQRGQGLGLLDLMGPSVMSRMQEAGGQQQARFQAGQRAPTPLTDENMWLADDVAGGMVGPLGMAGIFAGVGAKTANRAALETAERMTKEGADPRAIWRETGWFAGPDGKWRWEIDDSGARVHPLLEGGEVSKWSINEGIDAKETMSHGPLYEAYPDVAKVPTSGRVQTGMSNFMDAMRGAPSQQSLGGYTGDSIVLNAPLDQTRSTMLHELQHVVQDKENLARGGSPTAIAAEAAQKHGFNTPQDLSFSLDSIDKALTAGQSSARIRDAQGEYTVHGRGQLEKLWRDFIGIIKELPDANDTYRRLAGEAEARAIQARRDMTPEQRRATYPLDSFDVPQNELIVRGLF